MHLLILLALPIALGNSPEEAAWACRALANQVACLGAGIPVRWVPLEVVSQKGYVGWKFYLAQDRESYKTDAGRLVSALQEV